MAQEEAHGLAAFQGADTLQRRIAALLAFDATPHLAAVRLPTLLMAARDDVLVPSSVSEELAAAIEGATLHIAPWGAHAVNVTQADAFNAMLLGFLDAYSPSSRRRTRSSPKACRKRRSSSSVSACCRANCSGQASIQTTRSPSAEMSKLVILRRGNTASRKYACRPIRAARNGARPRP